MNAIVNPILPGFNPDPSILRVGEDYYIATSTFEWFPGVQVHHSRDLINWELLTHPLNRVEQLNMIGNPNSGGVWAPCLSYDGLMYYLVFTDVKSLAGVYKDTHNYLVTAEQITGPWSKPIYLNSSGFDPSLFHDEDGRKWLVNMMWDHRKGKNPFHAILLQEYSVQEQKLTGSVEVIFKGTSLGCTEGPHIYKREGNYYLMLAEGGTGFEHAVTMARAQCIHGPYEADPGNPILTSKDKDHLLLQKAGHGSLVETQSGEWYLAHLCARPLSASRNCNLGRETAIQRCYWNEEGWLRVVDENQSPQEQVQSPALTVQPFEAEPERDHFDDNLLSITYSTLREPAHEGWLSLGERRGWLRLKGRESLSSWHRQSLVAKRLQYFACEVETCMQFEPESFQQMAGLIAYYNTKNHYYLHVSKDESLGKSLQLVSVLKGHYDELLEQPISVDHCETIYMKAIFNFEKLRFFYSEDGLEWNTIGPELDAGKLSDECATVYQDGVFTDWGFTGTFVGICVQDLSGQQKHADFDYFEINRFSQG